MAQGETKALCESGKYYKKVGDGDDKIMLGEYAVVVNQDPDITVTVNGISAEVILGVKGFAIRETPEMYGDRLTEVMSLDVDRYFARREIARTDYELEEANYDLWQVAQIINHCRRGGGWPRNTSACSGFGVCPYFDLCTGGWKADDPLPNKYLVLSDVHPELQIKE